MKIAFLSTFYPFRGGIAQFNALLYRELEKVHEVKAFTFSRQYPNFLFPGKTQMVTQEDNADTIPSLRILDTINPLSYFRTAWAIKKHKPGLVITKYWMTFFAPSLGFVLGRQSRYSKRIAILDNVIPHERRFFDHAFNRYFLGRNDGFIAMTEKVKSDLLSYLPDAKCKVIPHPIYNQFGEKLTKKEALSKLQLTEIEGKNILLFFGIIRDYKGLDILLEVMALLDDSYHLLIAGEAYGDFKKYKTQMDELNIASRCHVFERYISDHEVPLFFSAADVVMLTYRSATQSGISGIAQHFELPQIATNVGGLAESIAHEKTGFVCDSLSPMEIQHWVVLYFQQNRKPDMQKALAAHNAANTWEQFAKELLSFCEEL
jgi:glycosyltransferase involved in cell wall biosynthesis